MPSKLSQWYQTARYIVWRYQQCNCSAQAAVLTLDTLLSLVPLLATSVVLFAIFPKLQHLAIQAQDQFLAQFIFDSGHDVRNYLQKFSRQAATVSLIGACLLLVTTIKMLYTLNQAFQAIQTARIRQKTYFEITLSGLVWIFLPILVGLGLAASSYIISLPFLSKQVQHLTVLRPFLIFIPIIINTLAFTFLYMVSPSFVVPSRNTLIGAFCAALLFEVSKWLFGLYIVHFPSYQVLYGSLAAIPLFLLWLNAAWQIALLGAIIAQALTFKQRFRSAIKLDGFTHAVCWLGYLWQAKQPGKALTLAALIEKDNVSYEIEPEILLAQLMQANLIITTKRGQYTVTTTIDTLRLRDLMILLPWKLPSSQKLQQLKFGWKDNLLPTIQAIEHAQQPFAEHAVLTLFKTKT